MAVKCIQDTKTSKKTITFLLEKNTPILLTYDAQGAKHSSHSRRRLKSGLEKFCFKLNF